MIGIINYGVGNISAFINIYKQLNIPIKIVSTANELDDVSKIILPGVGHFDYAMTRFQDSGMVERVNQMVLQDKIPVVGICVGMQMMAKRSDEGKLAGLGWIDAEVKKFDSNLVIGNTQLPLPHMGWNDIEKKGNSLILNELDYNSRFYFLHSYYFVCNNPNDIIAETNYGSTYTSAANHDNVYGIQFHPEKSHKYGIQLLKNFAELC
ncbi:MAG: imidazole glycerol phosphate synthase subunit HisH [Flavobacteriaceae bacterium]|jgi:glutamine amidotransferase|nr:imidazole glycerol phosphate synthase subunit HisH [Flavobacteriaceae bacterium]